MKKVFFLLILSLIVASCEKEPNETMTVVIDCTGTYLRQDGKDYHVCNIEKIASFADGATVIATYKKIEVCTGSAISVLVCERFHQNEGWIEVQTIK